MCTGKRPANWWRLRTISDNLDLTLKPVPTENKLGPYGEPVEPLQPAESAGDTPTMVDQGEEETIPHRRIDDFLDEK